MNINNLNDSRNIDIIYDASLFNNDNLNDDASLFNNDNNKTDNNKTKLYNEQTKNNIDIINDYNKYRNIHLFIELVYCPECDEISENIINNDLTVNFICYSCEINKKNIVKNKIIKLFIDDLTKYTVDEINKYLKFDDKLEKKYKHKFSDEIITYCLECKREICSKKCINCKNLYCGGCVRKYINNHNFYYHCKTCIQNNKIKNINNF
jgi:hypothetical protein